MTQVKESFSIGFKVKRLREILGMTRAEFSAAIGVPNGTLKGIESGNHIPSYNVIHKIANHPDMSRYAKWLISDSAENPDVVSDEISIPDKELLVTIVEAIEEVLTKKNLSLSPIKKGELIYILYSQAVKTATPQKIDRSNVLTLINYAR